MVIVYQRREASNRVRILSFKKSTVIVFVMIVCWREEIIRGDLRLTMLVILSNVWPRCWTNSANGITSHNRTWRQNGERSQIFYCNCVDSTVSGKLSQLGYERLIGHCRRIQTRNYENQQGQCLCHWSADSSNYWKRSTRRYAGCSSGNGGFAGNKPSWWI